ncbi:MAG: phage tail sheath subtilisin-like domain-containing protein [Pseudomonadota bacterium]
MNITLPFNDMPANLRLPGVNIEISNLLASQGSPQFRVLYVGQRLAAGTVAAGQLTRITRPDGGDELYGIGSMLAEMLRAGKAVNNYMETYAIALDDDAAAVAAAGAITIGGAASESGTLTRYIGGQRVRVAVTAGDSGATIATALAVAIGAAGGTSRYPVTAAVDGVDTTKVNLTAKHKGEAGNGIPIVAGVYGEKDPKGLAITHTAMAGGATNPDITDALAAQGAEWFNWIVMPYADAANMATLEAKLLELWGPTQQRGMRAFTAFRGNHGATSTYGEARNSPHVTCLAQNVAPQPPYIVAAIDAMASAQSLSLDPARPLTGRILTGMLPPAVEDRWTDEERNLLTYSGMSTYTVDPDGTCRIETKLTQYQINSAGLDDISYLYIQRPETLERIRYQQRSHFASRFIAGRYKLSEDNDAKFGAGQLIMTEDLARAELKALYMDFIERGWCDDLEGYMASIIIQIDAANGVLAFQDEPRLIGGLYRIAGLSMFRI